MTPQETLNKAADLLESSKTAWTQGCLARDVISRLVPPHSLEACSWCAMGAVDKAAPTQRLADEAIDILLKLVGRNVAVWNDDQTTKREDVIAMLRKAAL